MKDNLIVAKNNPKIDLTILANKSKNDFYRNLNHAGISPETISVVKSIHSKK